jgi:hypothetical protein
MGEARRRFKLGDVEFVQVDRASTKGGWSLPEGGAGALVVELGAKGTFSRDECRASADWLSRAAPQAPGALVSVTVGGFDDDPREVLDIPEAYEAFGWFGERLREIDEASGQPALLNRLDTISAGIVLVSVGLWSRSRVRVASWDDPAITKQQRADRERIDKLDQTIQNHAVAAATKEQKQ